MTAIDSESPPGSWEREMGARGLYQCQCGWVGSHPSTTEVKDVAMVEGKPTAVRVHVSICPKCFRPVKKGYSPK